MNCPVIRFFCVVAKLSHEIVSREVSSHGWTQRRSCVWMWTLGIQLFYLALLSISRYHFLARDSYGLQVKESRVLTEVTHSQKHDSQISSSYPTKLVSRKREKFVRENTYICFDHTLC